MNGSISAYILAFLMALTGLFTGTDGKQVDSLPPIEVIEVEPGEVASVTMVFGGEGGVSKYRAEDPELAAKAYALLTSMTIGKEVQIYYDDFSTGFEIELANGEVKHWSFNGPNLEMDGNVYENNAWDALASVRREMENYPVAWED